MVCLDRRKENKKGKIQMIMYFFNWRQRKKKKRETLTFRDKF